MHTPHIPSAHHAHTTCRGRLSDTMRQVHGAGCLTEPPPEDSWTLGSGHIQAGGSLRRRHLRLLFFRKDHVGWLGGSIHCFTHDLSTHSSTHLFSHPVTAHQAIIPSLTDSLPHTFPHAFMGSCTGSHSPIIHSFYYLLPSSNASPALGFTRDSVAFYLLPNPVSCCVCPFNVSSRLSCHDVMALDFCA